MKSRIVALATSAQFVGAGLLWAQTSTPQQQEPKTEGHAMGGTMMSGAMSGESKPGGSMMDDCKAMMAKRQAMMGEMKAMDAKLDAFVQSMNDARGSKKVDATAAVVTELVAQRKAMRESMESMHAEMMKHMMGHMQSGMMEGTSKSMSGCPMMGATSQAETGHDAHH